MLLFASCSYSNALSFDVKDCTVRSCSNKKIKKLSIKNDSINEAYIILFNNLSLNTPSSSIKLNAITDDYSIFKGLEEKQILNSLFKLAPNATYTIKRYGGDAGDFSIKIFTDKNGDIFSTSNFSCL